MSENSRTKSREFYIQFDQNWSSCWHILRGRPAKFDALRRRTKNPSPSDEHIRWHNIGTGIAMRYTISTHRFRFHWIRTKCLWPICVGFAIVPGCERNNPPLINEYKSNVTLGAPFSIRIHTRRRYFLCDRRWRPINIRENNFYQRRRSERRRKREGDLFKHKTWWPAAFSLLRVLRSSICPAIMSVARTPAANSILISHRSQLAALFLFYYMSSLFLFGDLETSSTKKRHPYHIQWSRGTKENVYLRRLSRRAHSGGCVISSWAIVLCVRMQNNERWGSSSAALNRHMRLTCLCDNASTCDLYVRPCVAGFAFFHFLCANTRMLAIKSTNQTTHSETCRTIIASEHRTATDTSRWHCIIAICRIVKHIVYAGDLLKAKIDTFRNNANAKWTRGSVRVK